METYYSHVFFISFCSAIMRHLHTAQDVSRPDEFLEVLAETSYTRKINTASRDVYPKQHIYENIDEDDGERKNVSTSL